MLNPDRLVRPRAIHQFHSGCAYGDGITNGMFFIQKILREAGYRSEIYCADIERRLSGRVRPYRDYDDHCDDLLLIHYSLGTDQDEWISALACRRVLVYHNITPERFFPEADRLRKFIRKGRHQLARWAQQRHFRGAIADSEFNAGELKAWGYAPVAPIPLLVDLDRLRAHRVNTAQAGLAEGARHLLFVGRVCEHKGQIELVNMLADLVGMADLPVRLLLAGATISAGYEAHLRQAIARNGLDDHVRILGRLDDADLFGLYRAADLYVSLSQHEGFGMPLVEAMTFDLPVLAAAAGGVAAALGPGGLVLDRPSLEVFAASAKLALQEPWLRRRMIDGQRRSVARYERPRIVQAFEQFLQRLNFDVSLARAGRQKPAKLSCWRIEGPFDTSYSLALVNRELARALARQGETIALCSRDGPGPIPPDKAFLAENPDLDEMAERARSEVPPDVCMRNQFPPHVADMRGAFRVLANYAWEESGFPAEWVAPINASLDLITVTSRYVAKVLRDNGVHVPIEVVGNGIDQILDLGSGRNRARPRERFRFLHVSSGFPRKGIDALLTAWGEAFTAADPVELVIKTFPNPHNRTGLAMQRFRIAHPDAAPISHINDELDAEAMGELLCDADAVVCPSRGEGFGLPLAEAMALGKPVVTTAHGGQTDFCTQETAWLCDYRFAYADTHLDVPGSVWAEPDTASLAEALREVFEASDAKRERRAEAGRRLVLARFRWDGVAQRTRRAIAAVRTGPADCDRLPRIGIVSTWNIRCGIAAYARSLAAGIEPERLHVFAGKADDLLEPDEPYVARCWEPGWVDPLDELFDEICRTDVDAVVFHFNFGFHRLQTLAALIEKLDTLGILTLIVFHSTMDVIKPEFTLRLSDVRSSLQRVTRILVHSVNDLNHLKSIGLMDNVALFPMGCAKPPGRGRDAEPDGAAPLIASFGYLLPHKGLRELIRAFAIVRAARRGARLLMLNAIYPAPHSEEERDACLAELPRLGLENAVTLVTDFLDEHEIVERLSAADVVVYPYQHTQESASAAVKIGLASLAPVAVTPLSIFADVGRVTHVLPGTSPEAMAEGLLGLLTDPARRMQLRERQARWVATHEWPAVARRLDGMIRGELRAEYYTARTRVADRESARSLLVPSL